jgi:hypothetical protein
MANVNNGYLVVTDSIIDYVRIATSPEGMYTQLGDYRMPNFQVTKHRNSVVKKCLDLLSSRADYAD